MAAADPTSFSDRLEKTYPGQNHLCNLSAGQNLMPKVVIQAADEYEMVMVFTGMRQH